TYASPEMAPSFLEREKMADTGIRPPNLYFPIEAKPAEAIQPHSLQTGCPPNWQGVIRLVKSAETQLVICANRHSRGELGGDKYPSRTTAGMCNFGNKARSRPSSLTTSVRS